MQQQTVFGLILPGMLPITQFQINNDILIYDLYNPGNVSQITFYLQQQLPADCCGALYYSTMPFEGLQFIGAIGNNWPSDTFNPGFPLNPDINSQQFIKLVIKLEPLENVKNLVFINNENKIQKEYGKKVAENLYNFMISFHKEGIIQNGDYLVLPTNCLDKWFKKFDEKFQKDPNFILRTTSS